MLNRTDRKELLDKPTSNKELFESATIYLQTPNRWLGNHALIAKYLKKLLSNKKSVSILDIGTGSADLPRYLIDWLNNRGISSSITAVDNNPDVIEIAKNLSKGYPDISFICSKMVPSCSTPYNIAILSQVLHHFYPSEAAEYLRAVYENVTDGIIISDLIRSRVAYWLVKLFVFSTTTNPFNRYDGPVSVLRCYNNDEIEQILAVANIKNFEIHNLFPRKIIIIRKP